MVGTVYFIRSFLAMGCPKDFIRSSVSNKLHSFYFIRSTSSVFPCCGVYNRLRTKDLEDRSLRAGGNLLAHVKDAFIWYWRNHFLMALGFQWVKYCSWEVGICHSLWALAFFCADLLPVNYFVNAVVKLKHLVDNFGCPRLVCYFFAYSFVLPALPVNSEWWLCQRWTTPPKTGMFFKCSLRMGPQIQRKKERKIVALRLGALGPFNLHSFFWRCA